MEIDSDLATLVRNKDHLNVLRFIRVHQLRQPSLVVHHGKRLLGTDLKGKGGGELVSLAALEQICYAALDCGQIDIADICLTRIKESGVSSDSDRFRLLLARCLEADGDIASAEIIYNRMNKDNPSNLIALKRKYCILKSQVGKSAECASALNTYLEQNNVDTAAWYELANLRMDLGDYKGASFCLEEVILGNPSVAKLHCELAECYATVGGVSNLLNARKHMAQALELDPSLVRAQIGLVIVSNAYLQQIEVCSKKDVDEFEGEVAKELIRYGSEQVFKSYSGSEMYTTMNEFIMDYQSAI